MPTSREATSRDRTGAAPASGVGGYSIHFLILVMQISKNLMNILSSSNYIDEIIM